MGRLFFFFLWELETTFLFWFKPFLVVFPAGGGGVSCKTIWTTEKNVSTRPSMITLILEVHTANTIY